MSLTPQQQAAARAPGSVVVTAGAGTGKTYMLVERYLYYLRERQISPLEMVAVTFTQKAANELRSRIRSAVSREFPTALETIAELEAAQISTIHALASRICRQYPEAAAVPPDFAILDDLEGKIWLADAFREALEKLPKPLYQKVPYSILFSTLRSLIDDPISASRSLQNSPENWQELADKTRQKALDELCNHPTWAESRDVLGRYVGKLGDKLEAYRQGAVSAIALVENRENVRPSLEAISQLKINVGSKKNWETGALPIVKAAIAALRELVKKAISQQLVTLELGEIDSQLAQILPAFREAFEWVQNYLNQLKYRSRVLTFSDLEVCALQALQSEDVRTDWGDRCRVFLIDEFQDTNPVQAELLEALTQNSNLTVVGDVKQSIYGFRRADARVFDRFSQHILANNGKAIALDLSFRTHQSLIGTINQIFKPLLGNIHQDLNAYCTDAPHPAPHLEAYAIDAERGINKAQRQFAEAQHLAKLLQDLLKAQTPIRAKSGELRPIAPGDIAILARTWDALQTYSEVLETAGIPAAISGGESLLATREAKDAIALLRFLADPQDDIALVALLRSPFFALSDRILFELARKKLPQLSPKKRSKTARSQKEKLEWWQRLQAIAQRDELAELARPIDTLKHLLAQRDRQPPSRLLQLADRLTGYTAAIANLPGAARREADWRGFRELVRDFEAGNQDVFAVMRRLKRLLEADVKVPRPPLDAADAVSLMTVHASKGLEWSVVVVADLARSSQNTPPPIYFDPDVGAGIKLEDDAGEMQKPVLYILLEQAQKQREEAEALRVLYVALTRARDRLILTACDPKGGSLDRLRPGLEAAGIPIQTWKMPETPMFEGNPKLPAAIATSHTLLDAVGSGLFELPVTALSDYAWCPQRFEFRVLRGHPGLGDGIAVASRIGTLVHKALELGIRDSEALARFDPEMGGEYLAEAIALARQFDTHPTYDLVRQGIVAREQAIQIVLGGLTLNGRVDLLGKDWVLDFKTDREFAPQYHRFQLWAYAKATGATVAHIAYLRHDRLHTFTAEDLAATTAEVEKAIDKILAGDYTATPSPENCTTCPYAEICQFADAGSLKWEGEVDKADTLS
ncbi:MAG: UvrD-helicase domain-containing protein [Cyanobacteriota bacterium]|nr:UvrD-helicase domain-containing protein [Cyanobacteriota bacterium]